MVNKKLLALVGASTFIAGSLYLGLKPARDMHQFYSTTPILTNPDGTIEGYRPLREGERLNDVLKEGPADSHIPKKNKCSILIINPDGTSHYDIKEFGPDGKLMREYTEPSDRTFKINPNYNTPKRNPDDKEC